jgi:hypothetical protein
VAAVQNAERRHEFRQFVALPIVYIAHKVLLVDNPTRKTKEVAVEVLSVISPLTSIDNAKTFGTTGINKS